MRQLALPLLMLTAPWVTAQVADAGPDTSLCVNYYTMQGSPLPPGATGQWTMVSGCGTITQPNDPTTDLNSMCIGTAVYEWTVDDNGSITTDQVVITVYDPAATWDAGPDQTAYFPPAATYLQATACSWPCQCHWDTSYYTFSDPFDPNAIVSNLMSGTNEIAWICNNGPCPGGPTTDYVIVYLEVGPMSTPPEGKATSPLLLFDPAREQVSFTGASPATGVAILDMSGRVVLDFPAATRLPVDVSRLGPGIYMAQAMLGGQRRGLRFVVSR